MDDETEELNRILCNAIKDILTHGCSSLQCADCPLYEQKSGTIEEKMCHVINQC